MQYHKEGRSLKVNNTAIVTFYSDSGTAFLTFLSVRFSRTFEKQENMVTKPKVKKPVRKKLPYKVIKSIRQYDRYMSIRNKLAKKSERLYKEEILLLNCLMEKWRNDNDPLKAYDPVALTIFLLRDSRVKASTLAREFKMSKGHLSDILNYKKNISKNMSVKLAEYFAFPQQLFCRPYKLSNPNKYPFRW